MSNTHFDTNELLPVVDDQGNVIGTTTRHEAHGGSMILHPVVHLHVFNSQGHLYLQKRPAWKDIQPSKWDTAMGGHVGLGESVEQALRREVLEEIGMSDYEARLLARYVFQSSVERELVNVFTTVTDAPPHPNLDELDGGRFWSHDEIVSAMGKGVFTPCFEQEYQRFFLCKP